ncbi:MAG: tetratricopeptide repeat protein, partial [Planctomycetota bacterium]
MQTAHMNGSIETAVQHHQAGRLQQAEQLYQLILRSCPGHPFTLHSLGMIAYQTARYDTALNLVAEAIENDPKVPQFHNTLGVIFEALQNFDQAIDAYRQAISLKPDYAEAYNNMAIALQAQGKYDAAIQKCAEAIALAPDYAHAHNTMGFALEKQGRFDQAIESYTQAVRFAPDFAEAYNHLGVVLNAQRRYEQAIENYRMAIEFAPDYAEAHWNLSLALLLTGRLVEGWRQYQWRRNPELALLTYPHQLDVPRWDGSTFAGKRLLVHYEQGYGDTIQFVRYLPMVKARGGTVILEARRPLTALLRGFPGIDELVEASPHTRPAVKFDLCASLMDLPALFNTTLDTIPADVPYLSADSVRAACWKTRLTGPDFKVGIVWSGSPTYERNNTRSCTLRDFAPLASLDGIKLYSLQKGPPAAQLKDLTTQVPVANLAQHFNDFSDTAAAIENLDLIISVDTSVL